VGLLFRIIRFFFVYLWELTTANVKVAIDSVSLHPGLDPVVVEVPIRGGTDFQIFMFANLITMTPGTISIDLSEDRHTLLVHCMYKEDVPHLQKEFKEAFNNIFKGGAL